MEGVTGSSPVLGTIFPLYLSFSQFLLNHAGGCAVVSLGAKSIQWTGVGRGNFGLRKRLS